ncbi:MAG: signal peptidase I [Oscillospiraceae bacterium]|nr:signal peptidase I [Oscillospiraceae bacterium]MDD3261705.1 signal peptidase I [Oscillospiraceae bacterium]
MPKHGKSRCRVSDRARSCYEWADALIIALMVVVLGFSFFLRVVNVSGPSMQPTLYSGDKVLLTSFCKPLERGDVIVVQHSTKSGDPIIKRVIATEGQTVNIDTTGKVSVNGVALNESTYLSKDVKTEPEGTAVKYPLTVPAGKVFVLGDNRSISMDSRSSEIGLIDQSNILGKAQAVLFPFSQFGKIKGEK